MKIGLIGIGQMGREMSVRLIDAGHDLLVWDRSPAAAGKLAGRARVAGRPEEAMDVEVVITMLADDAAVEAVWLAPRMRAKGVHLNMATVSLGVARELARLQEDYVSAPVFGRPQAAARGELDIIAAGAVAARVFARRRAAPRGNLDLTPAAPPAALERCRRVFQPLSRQVFVVGTN